jgi:hypothetical protein
MIRTCFGGAQRNFPLRQRSGQAGTFGFEKRFFARPAFKERLALQALRVIRASL